MDEYQFLNVHLRQHLGEVLKQSAARLRLDRTTKIRAFAGTAGPR